MSIFNTVANAIRWLVAGARKMSRNRELTQGLLKSLGVSEKIQQRVGRYFEKMAKVEELHGTHTSAWRKIAANVKAGSVTDPLDMAEHRYLYFGKKAFDDTIRPIGVKAIGSIDDTDQDVQEIPEVVVVDGLTAAEDDDGNLSVPED